MPPPPSPCLAAASAAVNASSRQTGKTSRPIFKQCTARSKWGYEVWGELPVAKKGKRDVAKKGKRDLIANNLCLSAFPGPRRWQAQDPRTDPVLGTEPRARLLHLRTRCHVPRPRLAPTVREQQHPPSSESCPRSITPPSLRTCRSTPIPRDVRASASAPL